MSLSPADRPLRVAAIWSFIPALAFLIAYGVVTCQVVPSLTLIPLGFSAICSLYHLSGKARYRGFNIFLDVFLAAYLLAMIIAGAIFVANGNPWWSRYDNENGMIMVGTFGLTSAIVNFCLHAYLGARDLWSLDVTKILLGGVFGSATCPHCRRELASQWRLSGSDTPDSGCSYVSVADADPSAPTDVQKPSASEYKDPRPSTDEETACLV